MAKCTECHTCMRRYVYVDNIRYLVCPVCKEVYVATPIALTLVTEKELKEKVQGVFGFEKGKIE